MCRTSPTFLARHAVIGCGITLQFEAEQAPALMKGLLASIALLMLFPAVASAANSNGTSESDVRDMPFVIAGGKIVSLPATDAGPIPAENDYCKIEAAGIGMGHDHRDPKRILMFWGFSVRMKSSEAPERITIEEVAPSDVEKLVLDDMKPILHDSVWSTRTSPIEPNAQATPWVYSDKATIFVFRFTIKPIGKAPIVMYQPAWFPVSSKQALVHHAEGKDGAN